MVHYIETFRKKGESMKHKSLIVRAIVLMVMIASVASAAPRVVLLDFAYWAS